MSESVREEVRNIERLEREFADRKLKLLQQLGEVPEGDFLTEHQRQEQLAKMFQQLSPGERMELYRGKREQWDQMLKATEAVGARKLIGW